MKDFTRRMGLHILAKKLHKLRFKTIQLILPAKKHQLLRLRTMYPITAAVYGGWRG